MDVRNGKSVYELPYQAKEITVRTIFSENKYFIERTGSRARRRPETILFMEMQMSTLFFFTCESSAISLLYNCLKARVNSMTFLRPNIIVSRRASVFKSEMLSL